MSLVYIPYAFVLLWLLYASWRAIFGTQSRTARVSLLVLASFLGYGTIRSAYGYYQGSSQVHPLVYQGSASIPSRLYPVLRPLPGSAFFCIGCSLSIYRGGYTLSAQTISARWAVSSTQPFVLEFRGGQALLSGRLLTPGCTSGVLVVSGRLELHLVQGLHLRLGYAAPQTGCGNHLFPRTHIPPGSHATQQLPA